MDCTFFFEVDGLELELGPLATAPEGREGAAAVATLIWLLLLLGTLSDLRSRMDLWKAIRLWCEDMAPSLSLLDMMTRRFHDFKYRVTLLVVLNLPLTSQKSSVLV